MRYFISIILPILMLTLAFYSMYHYQKHIFKNFIQDTAKSYAISTVFIALVKTAIALFLIVLVHNAFYDQSLTELVLLLVIFMGFSILQSAYSIGGFLTRNKLFYYQTKSIIINETKRFNQLFSWFNEQYRTHSKTLMKLVIIAVFVIVFLPNFSILLTTNLIFALLIIILVIISLAFNQLIYFGFVALLIFQYQPEVITFESMNLLLMSITFIVLFVGLSIDHRLQQKMFFLITMMPVKRFNFKLGYEKIADNKQVIIYKNIINQYYYVYFRKIGLVVVYHSEVDLKVSRVVQFKMIQYGKKYIYKAAEL
ncbi:MAG: hypothetical protein K9L26_03110 [Candidatus Izimaplasma sp.]|nr:hypothetical protein [Candidatus Izimaplasma bacterium]